TRLNFCEQSHILNRDDSLVGESLEKFDVCVRECIHVLMDEDDHADYFVLTKHRHGKFASGTTRSYVRQRLGKSVDFRLEISHANDISGRDRATEKGGLVHSTRE